MASRIGSVQGKVWGTTQCIFGDNNVEVWRINVKKGGYCSEHRHRNKYNVFYVECGRLQVTVTKDGMNDITILTSGMSTSIPPGEQHRFEALEDTIALEIYYIRLDPDDIERFSQGGLKC